MTNLRFAAALPICLLALALSLLGCTPSALQVQAATADAIARGVNAASPLIVGAYESDCDAAVDHAPAGEGKAALVECRKRWRPAWASLEALAAGLDAWSAQLVAGAAPDWAALLRAACAVSRVVHELAPDAPLGVLATVCAGVGP